MWTERPIVSQCSLIVEQYVDCAQSARVSGLHVAVNVNFQSEG